MSKIAVVYRQTTSIRKTWLQLTLGCCLLLLPKSMYISRAVSYFQTVSCKKKLHVCDLRHFSGVRCAIALLHTFCYKIGRNCYFIVIFNLVFVVVLQKKPSCLLCIAKNDQKFEKFLKNTHFLNKNSRCACAGAIEFWPKHTHACDVHTAGN